MQGFYFYTKFKFQKLEISTKVDFLRILFFLKYIIFEILNFSSSLCRNCCLHFILSDQDSSIRTELDSSIL